MTTNQANATKLASNLATTAPHWVFLLLLVGSFLFYMERSEQRQMEMEGRADLVATQRIEQCHDVQERSIHVMDDLVKAMASHTSTVDELRDEVRRIGELLDRQNQAVMLFLKAETDVALPDAPCEDG
jgi:hypothetical protein